MEAEAESTAGGVTLSVEDSREGGLSTLEPLVSVTLSIDFVSEVSELMTSWMEEKGAYAGEMVTRGEDFSRVSVEVRGGEVGEVGASEVALP